MDGISAYVEELDLPEYHDDKRQPGGHWGSFVCHDFIKMFESQYPSFSWETIQKDIFNMIKSVFKSAVAKPPPCGIADSPQVCCPVYRPGCLYFTMFFLLVSCDVRD